MAERPISSTGPSVIIKTSATSASKLSARDPAKDVATASLSSRRRTTGSEVGITASKECVAKKKAQSPVDQASFRSPRDPASPIGGGSVGSAVQAKGSPHRRQKSPLADEEPPCLPPSSSIPPIPGGGNVASGSGGNSPLPSGGNVISTVSPRGEIRDTDARQGTALKAKELESRLPPSAKVRELESLLSASTKAQVREVEARLPASSKAQSTPKARPLIARAVPRSPPPGLGPPGLPWPGLAWPGAPPGLDLVEMTEPTPAAASTEVSVDTDSFDDEVELLRCQAELVEAAAEIGTTSADDDFLTTDPDVDDSEDGLSALPFRPLRRGQFGPSVVIEEDDEGITDDGLDDGTELEDGSEMRSRLWAQSLLRLKRSIDEIYSLCEYESDEIMCEQVREILMTAGQDFVSLVKRFETQQEYALLPGEFPLKTGVAWTTRTPKATRVGESPLEVLERAQSPSSASGRGTKDRVSMRGASVRGRSSSLDPHKNRLLDEQVTDEMRAQALAGGGTGEAGGGDLDDSRSNRRECNREDNLQSMVQSALQRIHNRLGRPSKLSPEELSKRSEERHQRAQQLRAEIEEQRLQQLRQLGNRGMVARERRKEREQRMQGELLEKMTRARRQYQDQLRSICEKARLENRKTAEVHYITKEALKGEKEIMRQKQENARLARALLREQMRKKLLQSANRVAKVSENKRRQQEVWQQKVLLELEEKDRLASQRRKQHIHSIRVKSQEQESRSETVREKKREIQEEDERSVMQQQQDFVELRAKNMGRLALNVEGLPDGVREAVSEQLRAVPQKATRTGGRGRVARGKAAPSRRCTTPPPRGMSMSESLKSSPKSDVNDLDEDIEEDTESRPAQPSVLDKSLTGSATSDDGDDGEVFSEQEGSETGEPPVPADAELTSSLPATPQAWNSAPSKPARPKAKSDVRNRRSTSPQEAAPADNDFHAFGDLDALRKQLATDAMSDEEALKIATQSDASRTGAAVNAAHRARISKLATDLGRVLPLLGNTLGSCASDDSSAQQLGAHSLDLERADAVLSEFCKVLEQSDREADYALVLHLGCVGKVMDICLRIKDSIGLQSATERNMPPAMKQLSSVMLSALKWLGTLSKQKMSRVFFLLTNRVILLADVAVACLSAPQLLETQGMPSLFLPQVLHVLSLHMKQTLADSATGLRQKLVSYLLVCGLPEKLRDLFRGAAVKGMRLFDVASPVPLLLLRAMCCLGTLVSAYRLPTEASSGENSGPAPVLQVFRRTELFGIVSVLGTILFPEKGKPPSSQAERPKLPQTVTSLAVQAVRILNHVARTHLETLQEILGAAQQEFYHLIVCLLDYCALHQGSKPGQGPAQDESELLHESVVLLGNYCLLNKEHQALMCYGEGQTLLTKITSLPLYYFMDEKGKLILFPTILATCFESEQNLELLRNEMNLSLLRNFITGLQKQRDESCLPEAAANGFGGRFPCTLWSRAIEFVSAEEPACSSQPS